MPFVITCYYYLSVSKYTGLEANVSVLVHEIIESNSTVGTGSLCLL